MKIHLLVNCIIYNRQSLMSMMIQSCLSADVQESDCVRVRQSSMRLMLQGCLSADVQEGDCED